MQHRTLKCDISIDSELVELSFQRGREYAVIYARQNSGALVFEKNGEFDGALVSRDISEITRALGEWINEPIHGADSTPPEK